MIPARQETPEAREIPESREFPGREKFEATREGGNGNFLLNIPGFDGKPQAEPPSWLLQG